MSIQSVMATPVFARARAEIEALGLHISDRPHAGSTPYLVIGGRSNQRWWLIPCTNRKVAVSGMALFQPILASAKIIKAVAVAAFAVGLAPLWARKQVYISGQSCLAEFFGGKVKELHYAYFTGTDSPHRKVAIQIMDRDGNLKGFTKVTRNPQVRELLMHEAAILAYVNSLGLQTAYVPKVLFAGELGDSTLLVTDTLKTPRTPTTTQFTAAHRSFVQELAQKTAVAHPVHAGDIAKDFRSRFDHISPQLNKIWGQRLDDAIRTIEAQSTLLLHASLSHGDFTPWNTFLANGHLYVFDWEYAEHGYPPSNDIIHFILNEPKMRGQPGKVKNEAALACMLKRWASIPKEAGHTLLLIYLLTQTLRQIERLPATNQHKSTWDGSDETASMFDQSLTHQGATDA